MLVTFSHCWQHPSFSGNVSVGFTTGYDIYFRLERRCTFYTDYFTIYFCLCICVCVCVYAHMGIGTRGDRRRRYISLEMESQAIVRLHVGAGNGIPVL